MEKKQELSFWYFISVFLIIMFIQSFFFGPHTENLAYSDFNKLLKAGKLDNIIIGEEYITAILNPDGLEGLIPKETLDKINQFEKVEHQIRTVHLNDPALIQELEASNVRFAGQMRHKWFTALMSWILPTLFFAVVWVFLMQRMGGGGSFMAIGKNKARVYMERQTKVTFQDVAGVDEAKAELIEIIEFLKNPIDYRRLGARMPKGILLVGPPGTGKTLLARAIAGEAGVPFFSISGSEFVEMFVGVGAARVRDLFEQARKLAPAIIFIDELDALGRARGASALGGGNDEKEQTLNQLLAEMDGFDTSAGLILLAATNRPEILDPALLRAGRFDRHVLVDRPDKVGRIQILKVHLKKIQQGPDVDMDKIAALTPGFSGAELENLVNEAALLATRRNAPSVDMNDFTGAVERIVAGLEKKNRLLNPKERRIVAYHEMGHALVALSSPEADVIHKVSIIPRGIGSLGYTIQRPTDDRYLMTRDELELKMAVLLGGRAAEQIILGHLSTGAADDLAKVTDIARGMVMQYAMYEPFGQVVYEDEHPLFLDSPLARLSSNKFSEKTASEIDLAVREFVKCAFEKALTILKEHQDQLETGAQLLLQKETLNEKDLANLMKKVVPLD